MRASLLACGLITTVILPTGLAMSDDVGAIDVVRLSDAGVRTGEFTVSVNVINDERLLDLDIPLRFGNPGDPVDLMRVEFRERVASWDVKHVSIDNVNKTVIVTLISEVGSARPNAGLNLASTDATSIADLVFSKAESYHIVASPFSTEQPGHALTFYYNELDNGRPVVRELVPYLDGDVIMKVTSSVPRSFELSQNYPNPFNPFTSFALRLPEASDYSIGIFNVAGQLVKSYSGRLKAGEHNFVWDGKNDQGTSVASGVYLYKAEAGNFKETRRMMLLK